MVQRKYDVAFIIGIVLVLLSIASFRSEFRLRSEMPKDFFDPSRVEIKQRFSEEKVARAYWNCAVTEVQWKYGYARRLPDEPPPEFALSSSEVGALAQDEAIRHLYWRKLRVTWNVSSVWKNEWRWSFAAFSQSLRTGGDWWKEIVRSIVGQ